MRGTAVDCVCAGVSELVANCLLLRSSTLLQMDTSGSSSSPVGSQSARGRLPLWSMITHRLDFSNTASILKNGWLRANDWFDDSSLYILGASVYIADHIMTLVSTPADDVRAPREGRFAPIGVSSARIRSRITFHITVGLDLLALRAGSPEPGVLPHHAVLLEIPSRTAPCSTCSRHSTRTQECISSLHTTTLCSTCWVLPHGS